jgi:hypothetical protein
MPVLDRIERVVQTRRATETFRGSGRKDLAVFPGPAIAGASVAPSRVSVSAELRMRDAVLAADSAVVMDIPEDPRKRAEAVL